MLPTDEIIQQITTHIGILTFIQKMEDHFNKLTESPIFRDTALQLIFPQTTHWIPNSVSDNAKKLSTLPVCIHQQNIGKVHIFSSNTNIVPIIQVIITTNIQLAELAVERDFRVKESTFIWEIIHLIYDLNSSGKDINDKHLENVLAKISLLDPELHSKLWLSHQNILKSIETPSLTSNWTKGIFRLLNSKKHGLVISKKELVAVQKEEVYLSNAQSVVVIPIRNKDITSGALVLWYETSKQFLGNNLTFPLSSLEGIINIILEKMESQKKLTERQVLEEQMQIGFKIQQTLLLGQVPQQIPGLKVSAATLPSQNISGDFYDFFDHNQKCIDIVIGDVMGKGIPAALIAAGLKNRLLRFTGSAFEPSSDHQLIAPSQIINSLSKEISSELIQLESFVTLCYARFNLFDQTLNIVDCGHTGVLHYDSRLHEVSKVKGNNLPIGFLSDSSFEEVSVKFTPGDIFLFYSDGVTEARNDIKEFFGEERVAESFQKNALLPPSKVIREIQKEASEFTTKFDDDLTCIVVATVDTKSQTRMHRVKVIPSDLNKVKNARNYIENIGKPIFKEQTEKLNNLILAVNEALTNIIQHGYKETKGIIRLEVSEGPSWVKVCLVDKGVPFDFPDKDKVIKLDEIPKEELQQMDGGFGLYLIHNLVDEVSYHRDNRGYNYLYITKHFQQL